MIGRGEDVLDVRRSFARGSRRRGVASRSWRGEVAYWRGGIVGVGGRWRDERVAWEGERVVGVGFDKSWGRGRGRGGGEVVEVIHCDRGSWRRVGGA